jgi:dTDP-4-amino-4,6-dideoxygalactose transaminase
MLADGAPHARPAGADPPAIALLVPDLPSADEVLPCLRRIDANAWYTNFGPLTAEFERACAKLIGARDRDVHCVTTSSGTSALELALRASRLRAGSRVLVPSFTFPATLIAVRHAGHRPVLCDVDPASWVLTPAMAAALAREHGCAGAVPVATFGAPLDIAGWDALQASGTLEVVVDGAGALGTLPASRNVAIAYSLHATKPLGIGEGGLVATPDVDVAERVRRLSNYGFAAGRIDEAGTNAKLSEYASAVGLAQLARAGTIARRRRALWSQYVTALERVDGIERQGGLASSVPCNLVVRLAGDAEPVERALAAERIETRRWYCPPLHLHRAFAGEPRAGALDVSDALAHRSIGLPFHTRLSREAIDRVARALADAVGRRPPAAAAGVQPATPRT